MQRGSEPLAGSCVPQGAEPTLEAVKNIGNLRWAQCATCSTRVLDAVYRDRRGIAVPLLLEPARRWKHAYGIREVIAGMPLVVSVHSDFTGQRYSKHYCRDEAED